MSKSRFDKSMAEVEKILKEVKGQIAAGKFSFANSIEKALSLINSFKTPADDRGTVQNMAERSTDLLENDVLFDAMSEGMVVHCNTGEIEKFNREALKILGLTAEQLMGRTSLDPRWKSIKEDGSAFPGEEHPAMVALRTGNPVRNTIMGLELASGEERWIKINAVPFKANDGQSKVICTFNDITELISMNRTLIGLQEQNRFILKMMGIGIWKMNIVTQELEWDQSMYDFYELDPKDFSGHYQAWEQSLSPEVKQRAIEELNLAISGKQEFDTTFEILTKRGVKKNIGGKGTVIRNSAGRPIMMYGINWEMTKEVEMNQALEAKTLLLDSILENLPEMVFVKDFQNELRFVYFNETGKKLLEVTPEQFLGKNDYDFFPKDQADFFTQKDKEVFKSRKVLHIEKEPLQTSKGLRWLETYKVPTYKSDGSPNLLIGISKDITESVYEKQLDNLSRSIDSILVEASGSISDSIDRITQSIVTNTELDFCSIWLLDIDQSTLHAESCFALNPSFNEFKQFTAGLSFKIGESLVGQTAQSRTVVCWRDLKNHKDFKRKNMISNPSILGDGVALPIYSDNRILGIFELISSKTIEMTPKFTQTLNSISVRLAQYLLRQEERIKALHTAKLASLGEISAGIAHEVNNPLAIISGSLHLLSKFKDNPEKLSSKIEAIEKATARIARIVNGLKKFSRSSDGVERKNEPLQTIMSEAMIFTEAKVKQYSIPITFSIPDNLAIHCDSVEIEQVFVNLINNAIDAVKNSAEKWIKLNAFEDKESIVVQIADSGNCIPTEIETKLFLPFFTTKPAGEGTGLGLSIVRGILEQHKATIAINHSFKNTCFEIRFPKVEDARHAF